MKLSHKRKVAHKKGTYQPRLVNRIKFRCPSFLPGEKVSSSPRLKSGRAFHLNRGEKFEQLSHSLLLAQQEKLAKKVLEVNRSPYRRFSDSVHRFVRAVATALGFSHGVTSHSKTG